MTHPPSDPAAEAVSALRAKTTALVRQAMFADREMRGHTFKERCAAMDEISTAVANDILAPLLADIAALRTQERDHGEYIIDLEHKIFHAEADRDRLATELVEARAEVADLREALVGLDQRIWTDPQEIERAGEWRTFIARALTTAKGDADV